MRVGDLYIALCLIGVCVAAGWAAHEWTDERDRRLTALEEKTRSSTQTLYFRDTEQLTAGVRELAEYLGVNMQEEKSANAVSS